jgi:hypothetical protein
LIYFSKAIALSDDGSAYTRDSSIVMVQKQAKQVFGLGIACRLIRYRYRYRYRRRYRTVTNPLSAKLLADRVATLSELREHGHNTIEQCLLLAVVVCGQRIAHQRARPESMAAR